MSKSSALKASLSKVSWWGSVVVLVAIAIAGIIVVTDPADQPQAAPNNTPPAQSQAAAKQGTCDVPVGDTSKTPQIPEDLRWKAAKGWAWPVSDTYGPTKEQNGYGVCFARSPVGAALAMATIYGEGNTADPQDVTELYVADSPGKEDALGAAGEMGSGTIGFAGFKIDSFTKDEAEITMVFSLQQSPTGYMGLPVTLVWNGNDWKLQLLDDGSTFAGQPTTPSADDFVTWSDS